MKLESVTLFLGEERLQALVSTEAYGKQAVELKYRRKDPAPEPIADWYASVRGEVDWRLGEKMKEERGQLIPKY